MKLGVVFNHNKWNGRLTKLFTGCYAYHTIWVDDEFEYVYDISKIRRKRIWPRYKEDEVLFFDFPEVTREYLEKKNITDDTLYGYVDYILFGFRWVYHLFGKPTRNAGGMICSEMSNIDLRACGVVTPWELNEAPPSPCDLYRWCLERFKYAG